MIEILSEERCISCNICVNVCPTNVFEGTQGTLPVIARAEDCQTCWMCEAYCPVDALYVTPFTDARQVLNEAELVQKNLMGSYRKDIGWGKGRVPQAKTDQFYMLMRLMSH
jgi:NAD-dependent dihydropyrimidine dehydrogenase PreA subunit